MPAWSPVGPDQIVVSVLSLISGAGFVAACIRRDLITRRRTARASTHSRPGESE